MMKDDKTQSATPAQSAQDVRRKGEEALDNAKVAATDAVETGRARAEEGLNEGKNIVAQQVLGAALAAKSAAKDLRDRDQAVMADWADVAAENMTRAAESLEGSDLNQIYAKVEDYARRQPAVFLAGIALAGFAAARFAKAARERSAGSAGHPHPVKSPSYAEVNHV